MITLPFTFSGRINRAKYWILVLIWTGIWLVMGALLYLTNFIAIVTALAGFLLVASTISIISAAARRMHDRNKSGAWLFLFYLVPGILDSVGRAAGDAGLIFSIISLGISIWAFVEIGCLRGTTGANSYGPDPLQPSVAGVFE